MLTAFSNLKSRDDVINFLADLLTEAELMMLGKRLRIAKLILKGKTMDDVVEEAGAGKNTVAKVTHWLEERGGGFRKAVEKLPDDPKPKDIDTSTLGEFKRRYSSYFALLSALNSFLSESGSQLDNDKAVDLKQKLQEKRTAFREIDKAYRRT